MRNFILGTLFGIVIATVGFSGVTKSLDNAVAAIKDVVVEKSK